IVWQCRRCPDSDCYAAGPATQHGWYAPDVYELFRGGNARLRQRIAIGVVQVLDDGAAKDLFRGLVDLREGQVCRVLVKIPEYAARAGKRRHHTNVDCGRGRGGKDTQRYATGQDSRPTYGGAGPQQEIAA